MKLPLIFGASLLALPLAMAGVESGVEFQATDSLYMPDAELLAMCQTDFGSRAKVAQFADFQAMDPDMAHETMSELTFDATDTLLQHDQHYFLLHNGQSVVHAYFLDETNSGGSDPPISSSLDALEEHGGLHVGAIRNKPGKVICKVASTMNEQILSGIQTMAQRLRQGLDEIFSSPDPGSYSVRRRLLPHNTDGSVLQ